MNCREAHPLLPLFFDGELDARQLRGVALHSTRCPSCEQELQQLERIQDLVVNAVTVRADEVDLSGLWSGIEPRINVVPPSWMVRARSWWETHQYDWTWPASALAALGAAALLAFALSPAAKDARPPQIAGVDNSANLDVVESHVDSMALLSEPETNTMVLWISDEEGAGTEEPGGLP
jgi:anti-sigma factor RsiW